MVQDLAILQNISDTLKEDAYASQRKLAKNSGMSVGLMNAVLKRFVERGWIMLKNVNQRKFAYALTSQGLEELAFRGKKFVLRTFKIANTYSESITESIKNAKLAGNSKVILVGKSYIKFVIEFACKEVGIEFENILNFSGAKEENAFYIISEEAENQDYCNSELKEIGKNIIDLIDKDSVISIF